VRRLTCIGCIRRPMNDPEIKRVSEGICITVAPPVRSGQSSLGPVIDCPNSHRAYVTTDRESPALIVPTGSSFSRSRSSKFSVNVAQYLRLSNVSPRGKT